MNILKHENFHFFTVSEQFFITTEGPVSRLSVKIRLHGQTWLKISDLEFQVFVIILNDNFAKVKVTVN